MSSCAKLSQDKSKMVVDNSGYSELHDKIIDRISEIENSEYYNNSNLSFFDGFFEKNSFSYAHSFVNIDNGLLLVLLMLSKYPTLDLEKYMDEKYFDLLFYLNGIDEPDFISLISLFEGLGNEKVQELSDLLKQDDEQKLNDIREEINDTLGKDNFIIPNTSNFKQIIEILKAFGLLGNELYDFFVEFVISKFELSDDVTNYFEELKKVKIGVKLPSIIKKTYANLQQEKNDFEKKKQKKLTRYHILLKVLEKSSQEKEIVNIDEILGNVMEEDIYCDCLKFIYNHNQEYYKNLEKEYLEISENSHKEYMTLLEKYNIDFGILPSSTQKLLLEKTLVELEGKLDIITKFNFNHDQIILVCINSKLESLREIGVFVSKGYVTTEFIKEHFDILFSDNLLEMVNQNINLLLSNHVNLMNVDNKEILLISPSLLNKNIELLNKYSVNFMSRKITNLNMLGDVDLESKLNSFIEVGLLDTIKQDIQILNADKNLAKRIILSKSIGDEIFEDGKIKEYILKKDEFYITDLAIDSYIIDRDHSKYHSDCVITLTDNELRNGYYEIDGVIIPSGRVKNLRVSLDNIIVPSLYSREEVKKLEKYRK